MDQTKKLLETLKRILRSKGISYKSVAQELELSEPSIKRLFSKGELPVARLERICEIAGVDFLSLAKMSSQATDLKRGVFTVQQEEALSQDPRLFSYLYLLIGGNSPQLILENYKFMPLETQKIQRSLEKMSLAKFSLNGVCKLLITKNVRWLADGPLWKKYGERMKTDFLNSNFSGDQEYIRLHTGRLSAASLVTVAKRIEALFSEFRERSEMDLELAGVKRDRHLGLMVAYRPWRFGDISKLYKS